MPTDSRKSRATSQELATNTTSERASLGTLMPQLDATHDGQPVSHADIEFCIESDRHVQLVAHYEGTLAGAANLSILPHSFDDDGTVVDTPTSWLGSFVVDEKYRGGTYGVADSLWASMQEWALANGVTRLQFMTEVSRPDAIRFYEKKGARVIGEAALYDNKLTTPQDTATAPKLYTNEIYHPHHMYEVFMGHTALILCGENETYTDERIREDIQKVEEYGLPRLQYITPLNNEQVKELLENHPDFTNSGNELLLTIDYAATNS